MRKTYILGVGMTRFAKHKTTEVTQLGIDAAIMAIKDAGIDKRDIQAAYCGSARTGQMHGRECGVGQSILWRLGMQGISCVSVGNFCSSGGSALHSAWLGVQAGIYDVAIAIGVEKMSVRAEAGKPLTSDGLITLSSLGFTPPAQYAQVGNRYMYENGSTPEDFARVVVKNRRNGSLNPLAQMQKPVTIEEVLNSPYIVKPITLFGSCPVSDGGAVAIIASEDYMKKHGLKGEIELAGIGSKSGYGNKKRDLLKFSSEADAGVEAYEQAGIGPKDLQVAEVHDAFGPAEFVHYEALGFCDRGEAFKLVREGKTEINGGYIAVNPSGGLLSKGHPLGATGLGQVYEIVQQLRGNCGVRQVANAKAGLCHCSGGFGESPVLGEAQATSIVVLKK